MNILIKGMEMPTHCGACPFERWENEWGDYCPILQDQRTNWTSEVRKTGRRGDCPLVPVPPHGRLIDADALIVELMDRGIEGLQTDDWHEVQQAVSDAPTIIPAEEGE